MAITLDNLDLSTRREVLQFGPIATVGASSSVVIGAVPFKGKVEAIRVYGTSTSGVPVFQLSTSSLVGIHTSSSIAANAFSAMTVSTSETKVSLTQNDGIMISNAGAAAVASNVIVKVILQRTEDLESLS
jgi:hypothetical protein